jgi:hypothetical protein
MLNQAHAPLAHRLTPLGEPFARGFEGGSPSGIQLAAIYMTAGGRHTVDKLHKKMTFAVHVIRLTLTLPLTMTWQFLPPFAGTIGVYVLYHLGRIVYENLISPLRNLPGPSGGNFILGHFRKIQVRTLAFYFLHRLIQLPYRRMRR